MERRNFIQAAVAGSAGVALAGCIGGDDVDEFEPPLEFLTYGLEFMDDTVQDWNQEFEEETDIEAEAIHQTTGDDWHAYLRSQVEADDMHHVINTVHSNYVEFAEVYEPDPQEYLSDGFMDVYPESMLELAEIDGTLYRIPFAMDCGLAYYNEEYLTEAGYDEPPETTDEFFDVAEDIAENTDVEYGLATASMPYIYWSFFWAEGIDPLNESLDGPGFDTERTVEILERFNDLWEAGHIPEVSLTEDRTPQLEMFGAGDVAIINDAASGLVLFEGGEVVDEDTIGVTGAPGNAGLSMQSGLTIGEPISETAKEHAGEYIELVLSEEWLEEVLQATTWPLANRDFLEEKANDSEWQEEFPLRVEIYETLFEIDDDLQVRPETEQAPEVWSVIHSEFSEAIRGNIAAEDAVDQAAQQINGLF